MKVSPFFAVLVMCLVCVLSYQKGWISRDNLAKTDTIRVIATNAAAIDAAESTLKFQIDRARGVKTDAQAALGEAMNYETASDPDACGIPVDGVQLLQKIR